MPAWKLHIVAMYGTEIVAVILWPASFALGSTLLALAALGTTIVTGILHVTALLSYIAEKLEQLERLLPAQQRT